MFVVQLLWLPHRFPHFVHFPSNYCVLDSVNDEHCVDIKIYKGLFAALKRFRSLVYVICFVCGMDCTKDGCFCVYIFISVFIIFILKRINNQNVNHLHSFQQTDSQIDLHIIQTALNACEKQSEVRNQKKNNNKDMENKSKSKANQQFTLLNHQK